MTQSEHRVLLYLAREALREPPTFLTDAERATLPNIVADMERVAPK
jgi:hypothetical protein